MARIEAGRCAGKLDGDFLDFTIGMRINQLWAVNRWLSVLRAMPRTLESCSGNRRWACCMQSRS